MSSYDFALLSAYYWGNGKQLPLKCVHFLYINSMAIILKARLNGDKTIPLRASSPGAINNEMKNFDFSTHTQKKKERIVHHLHIEIIILIVKWFA